METYLSYLSSFAMHIPDSGQNMSASDIALPAAKKACEDVELSSIEGIIFATMTRDYVYPSSACMLSSKIGIQNIFGFDIDSDFTGFISALTLARSFVSSGRYKRILVVASEAMSVFSYDDIFINGSVAALITSDIQKNKIEFTSSTTDGSKLENCYIPMGGSAMPYTKEGLKEGMHKIKLKNKCVFEQSAVDSVKFYTDTLSANNITDCLYTPSFHTIDSHKCFVETMASSGGVLAQNIYSDGIASVSSDKKMCSVGAASSGISFASAFQNGFIKSGDKVAICAYGSGVTSALAIINID